LPTLNDTFWRGGTFDNDIGYCIGMMEPWTP